MGKEDQNSLTEEPENGLIVEAKLLFEKKQKLERLIRRCFKLTKFYRHCDSLFDVRSSLK
jgi:hypothetical protein